MNCFVIDRGEAALVAFLFDLVEERAAKLLADVLGLGVLRE